MAQFDAANASIRRCPQYQPTPLLRLEGLAARYGIGAIYLKDERHRFGLRSFKALGGPYAVMELVKRRIGKEELGEGHQFAGADRAAVAGLTIACASAGNHGQAVATGARLVGARCKVFLPKGTARRKVTAITETGADVVIVDGDYDHTVVVAAQAASDHDWLLVPDTSTNRDTDAVRLVMLGYAALLRETYEQMDLNKLKSPTHLFIQAGVGGLAGALAAYSTVDLESARPRLVVVEPESADCVMQSAILGRAAQSNGDLDTEMASLACGQPSTIAWEALAEATDDFVTVSDAEVESVLRDLSQPCGADPAIATSASGAAGLAPLSAAQRHPAIASALGLGTEAVVLAVITEDAV